MVQAENDTYYSATRSSDFIMQYMPVFAEATGDERWLKLYENTYNIINKIVDEYDTGICQILSSKTVRPENLSQLLRIYWKAKMTAIIITMPAVLRGVSVWTI